MFNSSLSFLELSSLKTCKILSSWVEKAPSRSIPIRKIRQVTNRILALLNADKEP